MGLFMKHALIFILYLNFKKGMSFDEKGTNRNPLSIFSVFQIYCNNLQHSNNSHNHKASMTSFLKGIK